MGARPGDLIANRFELAERAGAGGMGVVFRAHDRAGDAIVAVKTLARDPSVHEAARFAREIEILARMEHPSVVRYVAHGVTGEGEPFLAMEWLDGEDLARRLDRGPLPVGVTLALVRSVADALGSAHARGIVHRDVKPSNLFLRGGDAERVVVLDFGIARSAAHALGAAALTRTGMLVGTPGYIAPEQARGLRALDARADVFALGCVAYECLAGAPAFAGDNVMAILAKVLLDEPPALRTIRTDVSPGLEALVAQMLSKDPAQRPADGRAIVEALDALAAGAEAPIAHEAVPALTHREQRVVCVVLAAPPEAAGADATLTPEQAERTREAVQRAIAPAGIDAVALADGSIVAVVSGAGAATDLALLGARCAQAIRAALPDESAVAMCTGRAAVEAARPLGDAIDRVAKLVRLRGSAPGSVSLDEASAGLLADRFEIRDIEGARMLGIEREAPAGARLLLGRPSIFVGRDAELATLEAALTQCIDEPIARAVLVTAPPGVGKSRLSQELLLRARAREEAAPRVLFAQCDPVGAGSAFALAAQIVRRAAGIMSGDRAHDAHDRLRARLAPLGDEAWSAATAEFLGELIGAPAPGEPSPQLRSARGDPRLLGDQMRRAWEDWIAAECATAPLLVVIEDLQWGDLPSVQCIDGALRRLEEAPLMVVALARPEIHDIFPRLWPERGVQELRLGPLPRRASEAIVRAAMGHEMPAETAAELIARAGGNAFFLEELIRAAKIGSSASLPDSVLAIAQARLDRLAPAVRRALRGASVLGEVFWDEGVAAMLGASDTALTAARDAIGVLVESEVVEPARSSRFAGLSEYRFRHALLREAAYASLTDDDRRVAHALAGAWLERAGERDSLALGEHFERGGAPDRALPYFQRAAQQAYEGSDLEAAIALAERALACGARGTMLGALRRLQSNAHVWQTDFALGLSRGVEAFHLLEPGTGMWFGAGTDALYAAPGVGDFSHTDALVEAMRDQPLMGPVTSEYGLALLNGITALAWAARTTDGGIFVSRIPGALAACAGRDPGAEGWLRCASSVGNGLLAGEPQPALDGARAALDAFAQAGDPRGRATALFLMGAALLGLGRFDRCVETLELALVESRRNTLHFLSAMSAVMLGTALNRKGAHEAALAAFGEMAAGSETKLMGGLARAGIAASRLGLGDLEGAERAALEARSMLGQGSPGVPEALLAVVALRRGDLVTARRQAEHAFELLTRVRPFSLSGESDMTAVYIEVMLACGEVERAREAALAAAATIMRRASSIEDPEHRASYLANVSSNVGILARARQWASA